MKNILTGLFLLLAVIVSLIFLPETKLQLISEILTKLVQLMSLLKG